MFWTLVAVLPIALLAVGRVFLRERTLALCERFFVSAPAAWALTAVGWFWTARECDTINIDVFDSILFKQQTGGVFVYVLAAVLLVLTNLWMRPHLPCRALSGIFMLFPALAMRTTRLLVPAPGEFAPVQLLVLLLYLYAVCGMFGMFYPWHLENLVRRFFGGRPAPVKQEK